MGGWLLFGLGRLKSYQLSVELCETGLAVVVEDEDGVYHLVCLS